ncbi:COG1361 S-layer family protein [Halomicrococcus sp. NG-SE-24]|uniref:COG1361 S-layer family protein n=1 Tax=Halomicrococcus sp. NG-SE-24 TaxID=3436928 RepID=UPI003D998AE3
MTGRRVAVLLALALVSPGMAALATAPGPDAAAVQGTTTESAGQTAAQPDVQFRLVSTASNVPVDGSGNLSLTFVNAGDAVTNASVFVESPNDSVRFGPARNATRLVGPWESGERRTVKFGLVAEEFAETRSYPFRAVVAYTAANGSRVRTRPFTFGVRPSERILLDRFEVTAISSTVQAGETGTISVTVENTGADVDDAVVTLQSRSSSIRFGRRRNATRFVGEWPSNEDVTFEFKATASNDTVVASYPFSIDVSYSEDGTRNRTRLETFGVIPDPEQSFALGNVTSTLRVDDEGRVTGTVFNAGPGPAREAVLVLRARTASVRPEETRYPLGTIPAGERRSFRFDADVSNATSAGPREFAFRVVYRDEEGRRTASDPLLATVRVGGEREPFVVEPVASSFTVDESGTLRVEITNDAGRRLSNVTARLRVAEPLTSDDPSAYVGALSPGESRGAAFELTVEEEAIPGRQPATVVLTYETPDGERRVAGPYQVAVRVKREQGPGFPVVATVAVVAALFAGAGWWWWRGR